MARIIALGILAVVMGFGFLISPEWTHHGQPEEVTREATSTDSTGTSTAEETTIGTVATTTITPDVTPVPVPSPTPIPVPTPTPTPTPIPEPTPVPEPEPEEGDGTFIRTVGQREGSFLIQAVFPDRVDGLWFMAYPVAREEGELRTIRVGDDIGYACEGVSIKVLYIDSVRGRVTFQKKTGPQPMGGCPICLSSDTLIDTPTGATPVHELTRGQSVWTVDGEGRKVVGTVEKVGSTIVPAGHRVVHLVLADGRELFVSPGHPTADGRTMGVLVVGDSYDGANVVSAERIQYAEPATYDLLPSGETGFYYANGVLLGSTLKP